MNTLEAIMTRRSVRAYTDEPVSDEQIEILLKAAMAAPSAGNAQTWDFIVVKSQEKRDAIAKFSIYAQVAIKAPLCIVVCGNMTKEKYEGYWIQDCSAATQNILLAAHDIGLGAVWTGVYPMEDRYSKLNKEFNLPDTAMILGIIVIGHPEKQVPPIDRFDIKNVHHENW